MAQKARALKEHRYEQDEARFSQWNGLLRQYAELQKKNRTWTKSVELMQCAANLVLHENKSLREVCRDFELSKTSLSRFIKRMENDPINLRFGYGTRRKIFNKEQEDSLTEYLLKLAQIFHGIGPKEVRRMAYDYAIKYKINIPGTWHSNEWLGKIGCLHF
ncbi:unnamed protein product [Danaus chrysippus]|uniref:(African queen) hypothetical protein n=1 Tax=Danaus chrysippus TaxID=151541 RepID=A0A8J2QWE3_9NEOP|nr:unnamed protein product [Danaus chrysippus]